MKSKIKRLITILCPSCLLLLTNFLYNCFLLFLTVILFHWNFFSCMYLMLSLEYWGMSIVTSENPRIHLGLFCVCSLGHKDVPFCHCFLYIWNVSSFGHDHYNVPLHRVSSLIFLYSFHIVLVYILYDQQVCHYVTGTPPGGRWRSQYEYICFYGNWIAF